MTSFLSASHAQNGQQPAPADRFKMSTLWPFRILSRVIVSILLAAAVAVPAFSQSLPVLVIGTPTNPFSSYYTQILRTEGIVSSDYMNLSSVSASTLTSRDVVILGETTLTSTQVNMFVTWVNNGGNLIVMRPDKQLSGLLGLSSTASTLSNSYLKIDTSRAPGLGLTSETMQFHGTADVYGLSGATAIATLYSSAGAATLSPAASIRQVGSSGGKAAAFTFDLARSIVYTRQGNPAWAGTERDGLVPVRSNDMFFGAANNDPQSDWVDRSKIGIPQADEQQRLLANLILYMNLSKKPLPRFWYFPFGKKAAIVMTGDDHANNGTPGRFDAFNAASPVGCVVDNWECIRGTSYIYPETPLSPAQALAYNNQGHEVALHLSTNCSDYTPSSFAAFLSDQLATFTSKYSSLPSPKTNRTHCIVFSDWSTAATGSLAQGIRLDTNYYYWPASWVNNTPGYMSGSGMPQRFADVDGTSIDVYQAETQMTDESGQEYPFTATALMDRALGPEGYYGFFVANIHTDSATNITQTWAMDIVNAAKARGVPVITALQLLRWLDARNNSTMSAMTWNGTNLNFTVTAAANANGLQVMLPIASATGTVSSVTRNGSAAPYTTQIIKGMTYVVFTVTSGNYSVAYGGVPVSVSVAPSSVSVSPGATQNFTATVTGLPDGSVSWSMNPAVGTLTPVGSNTVSYTAPLSVTSPTAVQIIATPNGSFVHQAAANLTIVPNGSTGFVRDTTMADFQGGTLTSIYISTEGDGAILAAPAHATEFASTTLPSEWVSTPWVSGGATLTGAGGAVIDGARLNMSGTYPVGTALQFTATFGSDPFQYSGWAIDMNGPPWAVFGTGTGGTLYARTTNGSESMDTNLGASYLNGPHVFRIRRTSTSVTYSIDGVDVVTHTVAQDQPLRPLFSDFTLGGNALSVTSVRVAPFAANASFVSRVLDGGSVSDWGSINWTADAPSGANLTLQVRRGDTPVPDGTWSPFVAIANGGSVGGSSRYLQYQAIFQNTDTNVSATLRDVTVVVGADPQSAVPTITGVSVVPQVNGSSALVNWTTNIPADSLVSFGTSAGSLVFVAADSTYKTSHSILLTGLAPATTHYLRVTSATGTGSATSPQSPAAPVSFATLNAAPVITNTSVSPGTTSVSVTWTTNIASTTRVQYGLSPTNLNLVANNGSMVTAHTISLTGLTTATTYYYRVISVEPSGATSTFPAPPADPATFSTVASGAPVVSSVIAVPTPSNFAQVRWSTNKPANSRVNYGTSSSNLNLNVTSSAFVDAHNLRLSNLTEGTRYYYRVVVVDQLGNSTTFPPTTSSPLSFVHRAASFWSTDAVPSVASDPDNTPVEVGMKFLSTKAGLISGVMFYKGAANTGTHVGSLWTAQGDLLARVTFQNETASGWQVAVFSEPVAIAANVTYVVSYHAPNGSYAFDQNYFANGLTVDSLYAIGDGNNGVYQLSGQPAFPTQSYQSSNYWVDVIFSDLTPPAVTNLTVAPAGTSASIRWTTSEPATAQVLYGTSSTSLTSSVTVSTLQTSQVVNLTGLTTNRTYFYRVVSADAFGNTTTHPDTGASPLSFNSGSLVQVTISNINRLVGSTSAVVTWTTNLPSDSRVEYGTSSSNLSQNVSDATLVTAHTITLSNLNPGTTYFYRVRSTVTSGNSAVSSTLNFATSTSSGGPAGNPPSEWDIEGAGDETIQGFATDISYNRGQTASFKISTNATGYTIRIYRLGYYQGNGAALIATVNPSVSLPQNQPACLTEPSTGLIDCGNWAVSATWAIPSNARSGVYVAKLTRNDTGGASHIVFVVRDDSSTSDIIFQTSDTTWQAYNTYGGNSLYVGAPVGRAYKVSYNRPFITRGGATDVDWLFVSEYPMIRWLEANGYDVTYTTGVDSDRRGSLLTNHKVFLSVGHDEYWSGAQRTNVENARNAGLHMMFLSGNEVFWKTRWENSISTPATAYRTLVSYKETHAGAKIDPTSVWTGTWRDARFSPPADGGRAENALTGTMFMVNCCTTPAEEQRTITVSSELGKHRFWRNTAVANLAPGQSLTLTPGLLGYEWDEAPNNASQPAGLMRLSSTTYATESYLQDNGSTYAPGIATHNLTLYRHSGGALVFGAGTTYWPWGLDANHDRADSNPADVRVQQATLNLLADMGVQPTSIQPGLVAATTSTDSVRPTTSISSPASGATVTAGNVVTVTGSASDTGGIVTLVELSVDGGLSWKPANGTTSWSFAFTPAAPGSVTIRSRAYDDSGNVQNTTTSVTINAVVVGTGCSPCSLWPNGTPGTIQEADAVAHTLGLKFRASVAGKVTGVRFYKGPNNIGTHTGQLWTSTGTLLASVTFADETATGWQQAYFSDPVTLTPNTTYIVSYYTPTGWYSVNDDYFVTPAQFGPLTALQDGTEGPNGIYRIGSGFPTTAYRASNYWVDVIFAPGSGGDTTAPVISNVSSSVNGGNATIQWSTNELATRRVVYGTAAGSLTSSAFTGSLGTAHSLVLTDLVPGTVYHYRVLSGDAMGNIATSPAAPSAPATFTTAPPQTNCNPCSIWGTPTPAIVDVNENDNVELGVKFRSQMNGQITGVRFYKSAANGGTHVGRLWSSTGTELASVTFTNESSSGWQLAVFNTPVTIAAGTTYIVSYRAPVGHYSASTGYFTSQGVVNAPLTALQSGVDGLNGVYKYGGGFPTDSFNDSNYWVDVLFVPASVSDTTPPNISALVSVPTLNSALIQWTTNELSSSRVDYGTSPAALTQNVVSATLKSAHELNLPGLTSGTTYYYRVTSVDGAGNSATSPASPAAPLSFTTLSPCNPCSVWSLSNVPAVVDAGDPDSVELGIKFRASTVGAVTGMRFYKAPGNTGLHKGTLWDIAGNALATVDFTAETPSGWQQAAFASPVNIQAGATYVISYFAPNGHYSLNAGFFAESDAVNGPLTALQNGTDGANGVYRYGTAPSFPTSTFNSANYWVDVVFAPAGVPDTTAPTVFGVTVAPQETSAVVTWSLSEPASSTRIDYGTSAALLNSSVLQSGPTMGASIPLSGLTPGTTYYFRIAAADAAGNSSTTPAAPAPPQTFTTADTVAPVISGVAANPTETAATIQWITDEPANSRVDYGTAADSLTLSATSPSLTTSRVVTLGGLTGNITYYYRVRSTDAAGNSSVFPAEAAAPLSFTTPDQTAPVASGLVATPATSGTSATVQWTTNEPATARVDYGTSAANLNLSVSSATLATNRTLSLTGLQDGTTYYYRVTSTDAANNSSVTPATTGAPGTFTTPDVSAPVVSALAATPAATTATVQWTTNEPASSRVNYGTSPSNLNSTVFASALVTSRTLNLTGLSSQTTYYFRVVSIDAAGNSRTFPAAGDPPATFATLDVTAPSVTSISVTSVGRNSATVNWTTNEPATTRVNYGTSSGSLNQNVQDPALVTAHTITITGLTAGTQYFYKVVSADAAGNTTTAPSNNVSFTTTTSTAAPSAVTIVQGTQNSGTFALLSSSDNNRYQVNSTTSGTRTTQWYGSFTNIPRTGTNFRISYEGSNSSSCTQQLGIYNFSTSQWVNLGNSQSVGTSDVTLSNLDPSGTDSNYVSGSGSTGEVRVRVVCTNNSNFTSRGDWMQLTY